MYVPQDSNQCLSNCASSTDGALRPSTVSPAGAPRPVEARSDGTGNWDACDACYRTLNRDSQRMLVLLKPPAPQFGFMNRAATAERWRQAQRRAATTVVDGANTEVQLNALGLLARLHLRGVNGLRRRWMSVVDACDGAASSDALHCVLRVFALSALGRDASELLQSLRDSARRENAASHLEPFSGGLRGGVERQVHEVAAAVRDQLSSLLDEAATRHASARLRSLRGRQNWAELGGSEEQRMFLQELVDGPMCCGSRLSSSGSAAGRAL